MNHLITLCYGPIEDNYLVKYDESILHYLIKLLSHKFHITLERIKPRDRLVIKLGDFEIFRCRLTFLRCLSPSGNHHHCNCAISCGDYNKTFYRLKRTVEKAVYAVFEAHDRFEKSKYIDYF